MQQKIGTCTECEKLNKPLNSRGICPDCIFIKTHAGKTKEEVYTERRNNVVKVFKPVERSVITYPKKRAKTSLKLKNERLEKRRAIIAADEALYYYIFLTRPNECEECGTALPEDFYDEEGRVLYRSQYSHIITKGSAPEFRHDKRNINRVCGVCHDRWEFHDRENMNIYAPNQIVIQQMLDELNKEYN